MRFARFALAVLFVSACVTVARVPGSGAERVERRGDCFDVWITGQPAVPLDDRATLRGYAAALVRLSSP